MVKAYCESTLTELYYGVMTNVCSPAEDGSKLVPS